MKMRRSAGGSRLTHRLILCKLGSPLKMLDQLDQELWYQSSEDYAKYTREAFAQERALVERLGLLAK